MLNPPPCRKGGGTHYESIYIKINFVLVESVGEICHTKSLFLAIFWNQETNQNAGNSGIVWKFQRFGNFIDWKLQTKQGELRCLNEVVRRSSCGNGSFETVASNIMERCLENCYT